mgnify:CR=1 FL=1
MKAWETRMMTRRWLTVPSPHARVRLLKSGNAVARSAADGKNGIGARRKRKPGQSVGKSEGSNRQLLLQVVVVVVVVEVVSVRVGYRVWVWGVGCGVWGVGGV